MNIAALKIVVLLGGWSSEREVSLSSGAAVVRALKELGCDAIPIDPSSDLEVFVRDIKRANPDLVFNALHGTWGEDGRIQAVLDYLKVSYTHSDVLASALGMSKVQTKRVLVGTDVVSPLGVSLSSLDELANCSIPYPYVVKPASEGSSVGVEFVHGAGDLERVCRNSHLKTDLLVEQYIPGAELSCAVLNGRALGVIELRPTTEFYTYEAKYSAGLTEHVMPADIPQDIYALVMSRSETVFWTVGCRGLARADFRYDDTKGREGLFFLEINTQPGLTELSLAPEIARYAGLSFTDLVRLIVEDGLSKKN